MPLPTTGELPESGRKWESGGVTYVERVWLVEEGTGAGYVPARGSSGADGLRDTYSITVVTPRWERLSIVFASSLGSAAFAPSDGTEEWSIDDGGLDLPLEKHAGYKVCWNYDLYANLRYGSGQSAPGWASTDTTQDITHADNEHYTWAKESPGSEWIKVKSKTKPGVESFMVPSPVVQYEFWHATRATAEAALHKMAIIEAPTQTYGYSGGSWLVVGASCRPDRNRYRVCVRWQYDARGWDTDLYTTGTTGTT